jgi:hypothetical protein
MRRTVDWRVAQPELPAERNPAGASPLALLGRLRSAVVLRSLLFVAIFSVAAVPPLDPDLWWHLANGRLMLATRSIPHLDLYSFSAVGHPWVMHEWLADLGMYGLYRLGGLPLLVAFFALIVTATAAILYGLLRHAGLHPTAAVVLTLVAALAGSTAWGARPQELNPLLMATLLAALIRYREGRLHAWMLPPFIWLWANLHSGFVVGVIIAAIFLAGEAFDAWRGTRGAMPWARLRALAIALAVSLPLAAANPFGIQALLFAIGTLTSPLIQNNIQEWASPDFHSLAGLMLEAIVLLMIGGLITGKVRVRSSEWMWALALLYLALSSQRHVGLFVLGAAPLYGRSTQALLAAAAGFLGVTRRPAGTGKPVRLTLAVINLALLVVVGAGMVIYRALPNLEPTHEAQAIGTTLPVSAVADLASLKRPMRIFNDYSYGGYLIWTLYPTGGRVYIDGRVEVYGAAVFSDYLRVDYLATGWPGVLAQANPDVIILPNGHPLIQLLEQDASWQQFSRDRVATVLVRVGFAP